MSRIESSNSFRLQGETTSIGQLVEQKKMVAFKLPEHLQAELALHDQQVEARLAANQAAAAANPDKVFAQIVQNGQVVAMVYDSGTAVTQQNIPGLKLTEDFAGRSLADRRLAELTRAVPGTVIYDNFLPLPGQTSASDIKSSSSVDQSLLPKVTARGLGDMTAEIAAARDAAMLAAGIPLKKAG
ncbi:hypothetical protein GTP55_07840 [Duganella sp. FT109W]|uniref:Uncharacterized protein n=1 Tax=Duganella margarita TaxID=2692170 RepID=A0ABW9WE74_9BURK|nr:hypothetical protein [Duganella margarita]MYN39279.1 hypothetical protein [Duganella margarita]